jgi:hypothetical protein
MMRPTSKEQFETVYLRVNGLKQALAKFTKSEVAAILKDPQFQKCTSYIARSTFNKNMATLLNHGFGQEDILSISQLYGLNFHASSFTANTDRDKYYIMMRYINQRFEYFFISLDRKFGLKDKLLDTSLDAFPSFLREKLSATANIEPQPDQQPTTAFEDMEEELEFLDFKVGLLRDMSASATTPNEKRKVLNYKKELLADQGYVADQIKETNNQRRAVLKAQKDISKRLKDRMAAEGPLHADKLCYHATSKYVPTDVRNKAREYCRRMKIDFVSWAKKQVAEKGLDDKDFVL